LDCSTCVIAVQSAAAGCEPPANPSAAGPMRAPALGSWHLASSLDSLQLLRLLGTTVQEEVWFLVPCMVMGVGSLLLQLYGSTCTRTSYESTRT
jgi:hypothetical protein